MTSLTERVRTLNQRRIALISVAVAVTALVAMINFLQSYQHQYELAIYDGQTHWVAGLYPLSVDFLIVAASLAIWYAVSEKLDRPWRAYIVLAGGGAATVIGNLAADDPARWGWVKPGISVWPAVAFFGTYEMAVWMVRSHREKKEGEGNEHTLPGVVPQTGRFRVPDLGRNGTDPGPNGHVSDQATAGGVTLPSGRTIQRKPDSAGQKRR